MKDHPKGPKVPVAKHDDYWSLARQPLPCLLFLLPLLATYEIGAGVLAVQDSARNGADYWLRSGLHLAGFKHPWLLPVVVVGMLVAWQIAGGYRWKASPGTLIGMLAESALFGGCLVLLGQLQDAVFHAHAGQLAEGPHQAIPLAQAGSLPLVITYLGAGVYEETLFRLCLIPATFVVLRLLLVPRGAAMLLSVLATSVLFSLAHYAGPSADQFTWFSFVFRASAGLFFAILFVVRGFGVTVGSHAAYDVIVGVLIPAFVASHGAV
ncbi:MAG: CPBP family intramembrane metalloprotease [Planctomycetia bacterium]|nr:CPBP family intramembrane metalloprotease [Planctomycetia bacterium]